MKARNEMNPEFTWDFSDIYASVEDWEKAVKAADSMIDMLPALHGTLGDSADSLKKALDKLFAAQEAAEKPYIYAMLFKSADNSNPAARGIWRFPG